MKEDVIKKNDSLFMKTYARFPAVMVKGSGCWLQDIDGRNYLDFLSGIAVCSLGHNHPDVTEAICRQAAKLNHVSNLYYTIPQTEVAELLVNNSFADRVFMANSGAEANEAAIKLARKYGGEGRYKIICLEGSFHGRTMATVSATGQNRFHKGFEPLLQGFCHVQPEDLDQLEKMIDHTTCAVLCEPVQGEGGVRPLSRLYLKGIRLLCDRYNLKLIFDEVQVGMGRTGSLFAYEQFGIEPDIITSAKALGNGIPIGAMLARESVAEAFQPGDHAATFGGNPVACAAAKATIRIMLQNGFLKGVKEKGTYLQEQLNTVVEEFPKLARQARGMGLIRGLVLTPEALSSGTDIVNKMFKQGVLINFAGGEALRFLPPLIISKEEIDKMIHTLKSVLAEITVE
ncbi:MAG: aspartate aminotransferase family protein [Thermodesulfobacteriota bacterium]